MAFGQKAALQIASSILLAFVGLSLLIWGLDHCHKRLHRPTFQVQGNLVLKFSTTGNVDPRDWERIEWETRRVTVRWNELEWRENGVDYSVNMTETGGVWTVHLYPEEPA